MATPAKRESRAIPDRKYSKPPVIEALCEVYFAESTWDDTVPGAFYERVKEDFPQKRQRGIQHAQITLGPREATAGVRELPPWMQFVSENGNRMIQVAENLLVVNQLQPYPNFEAWEPVIHQAVENYRELTVPLKVARLGVRYINRVAIPGAKLQMEDYFNIYPNLPKGLGDSHGDFSVKVEIPESQHKHNMLITFGTAPRGDPDKEEQAFLLDLYDILDLDKSLDEVDFQAEVQTAHENIILAFEDSITDRLRGLFVPESQT